MQSYEPKESIESLIGFFPPGVQTLRLMSEIYYLGFEELNLGWVHFKVFFSEQIEPIFILYERTKSNLLTVFSCLFSKNISPQARRDTAQQLAVRLRWARLDLGRPAAQVLPP